MEIYARYQVEIAGDIARHLARDICRDIGKDSVEIDTIQILVLHMAIVQTDMGIIMDTDKDRILYVYIYTIDMDEIQNRR